MRTKQDLRPVQQRIVTALYETEGLQLVMSMGGGKTVSALTAIRELIDDGEISCAIVAAPARVAARTWPQELAKWQHLQNTDMAVLTGPPGRRRALLREPHEVYVVSIENLPWLVDELRMIGDADPRWQLLVIDELSRFQGARGARAKKLNQNLDRFGVVWGLTGTPRSGSWERVWMPLQLVSKGRAWGQGFDSWRRDHFRPLDYQGLKWELHDFYREKVQATVNRYSLTIPPEEVVDTPYASGEDFDIRVDLDRAALRDLDRLEKKLLAELGADGAALLKAIREDHPEDRLLVALSEAQASGLMTQVLQGFLYEDGVTVQTYRNAKLEALEDLHEALDGEPCLIAYHYHQDLANLRALLGQDLPSLGSGVGGRKAEDLIDAWNRGSVHRLAIHPASAGHGIELQFGGRRIVWYSPTWSPELYAQTIKRIARPGQELPVFSHRILANHWLEDMRTSRVEHALAEQQDFVNAIGTL